MNLECLRDLCLSLPDCTEDLPFDENTLAFRVLGKIFVLTDLVASDRFNAKCDPQWAISLRERFPLSVFPGYHMNKKHWNTILMDARLPEALLEDLVRHAHSLIHPNWRKTSSTYIREW
jgi:predicted DNA-binding protein (MmcQ/YjbR family)